jgi:hypothetical protein
MSNYYLRNFNYRYTSAAVLVRLIGGRSALVAHQLAFLRSGTKPQSLESRMARQSKQAQRSLTAAKLDATGAVAVATILQGQVAELL